MKEVDRFFSRKKWILSKNSSLPQLKVAVVPFAPLIVKVTVLMLALTVLERAVINAKARVKDENIVFFDIFIRKTPF